MTSKLYIEDLNKATEDEFTEALKDIYEHSSWIPREAAQLRPFANVEALHQAMLKIVKQASKDQQLALLRAHPQLAGQEAKEGTLTDSSTEEQAAANLNALSNAEMQEITAFNNQYMEKHSFPFIIAVKNHTKAGIFSEFKKRINHDTNSELFTALTQVGLIATFRLSALLHNYNA